MKRILGKLLSGLECLADTVGDHFRWPDPRRQREPAQDRRHRDLAVRPRRNVLEWRDSHEAIIFAIGLMIGVAVLARGVLAQQPGQPGRGGPPNPLLQVFDTDRDGSLSAAEIDAAAAKLRERDANKDGKLTADELPRGRGGRWPGRSWPRPGGDGGGQRPEQAPPAQGRRREANPRRARAGPPGRAVRQRLDGRRPPASPAHRVGRRQTGRRAGHVDRRVGALVLDGPAQDRRQALHPRHRPRPDRRRPRELQEGRRRGHRRHHRGRRPPDGDARTPTRSTSCSSTPRRRATTPTSRNCCPTSARAA